MARLGFLRAEEPHGAYSQQQDKNTGRQLCQYEFHHILLSEVCGSNVGETFAESSPDLN